MTTKKISPFLIAVIVLLIALAAYLFYTLQSSGSKLPIVKEAPDFTLQELDGSNFELKDNQGKVMLIEFMFTSCPDICPVTTYNMVLLQDELKKQGSFGSKVQFASVTFDPNTDTPDVLRSYGQRMGIDQAGWKLLRGDEAYTIETAKQYGIAIQKLDDGQFVHTVTSLMLVDAKQQIRKVYRMGDEMDNSLVLKDINTLLKEK
ncbi:SCO family protein [Bacillus sp. FJAT-26390]|uniref:SCO family protein n=1 Tax=Bacillus sp. FJAT-26390 TaxID=1743142 RepID=UPI000807AC9C|nr:SCO family protein [Bacillus sp. FJAT-26390]OBZ17600.1 electron transport protein SCO1/SenC [Bacillus sp. FJAT-26390]